MILGSDIAAHIDGVWGCEFVEEPPLPGFQGQPKHKLLELLWSAADAQALGNN